MKWCESCRLRFADELNFCDQCGRALRKPDGTPLLGNLCLGSEFVDGYTRTPDGKMERAGGNTHIFYDHEKHEVQFRRSFYGGGRNEESKSTLPIPREITTKEALVDYVRRECPGWRLNCV